MIFFISITCAIIPIAVYILFTYWLDRYMRDPFKYVVFIFCLGAIFSTGFSYIGNTLLSLLTSFFLTTSGHEYLSAAIIAPVIEETNKSLIVVLFALIFKKVNNLTKGLFYGAVVGLGFAFSENILYFTRVYESYGQFQWLDNMVTRSIFSAGVHATATAIFGGIFSFTRYSKLPEKLLLTVIGWSLAVTVHSFWNGVLTVSELAGDSVLSYLPFISLPFVFLLLFVVFQFSLWREHDMIVSELKLEAKNGIIPQKHIKHLGSYLLRSRDDWLDPRIPKPNYIQAATQLAFLKNLSRLVPEKESSKYSERISQLRDSIKQLLSIAATKSSG